MFLMSICKTLERCVSFRYGNGLECIIGVWFSMAVLILCVSSCTALSMIVVGCPSMFAFVGADDNSSLYDVQSVLVI